MEILSQPEVWIALATLTALEIVLGIDNIIFISILVGEPSRTAKAAGKDPWLVSRNGIETATSFYSYFYHGSYKTDFYSVFLWIFRSGFNTNFWGTFFTSKKYTRDTLESRSL